MCMSFKFSATNQWQHTEEASFSPVFRKEAEQHFGGKGRTSLVWHSQHVQGVLLTQPFQHIWWPGNLENNAERHSEIWISSSSSCISILLLLMFVVYNSTSSCLWVLSGVPTHIWQTMEPAATLWPWEWQLTSVFFNALYWLYFLQLFFLIDWTCLQFPLFTCHKITESQNGRGWKGPLWVI